MSRLFDRRPPASEADDPEDARLARLGREWFAQVRRENREAPARPANRRGWFSGGATGNGDCGGDSDADDGGCDGGDGGCD